MNAATLRRLQERMAEEQIKPDDEMPNNDDPAAEDPAAEESRPQTIFTTSNNNSSNNSQGRSEDDQEVRFARQLREQQRRLEEIQRQHNNNNRSTDVDVDAVASQMRQTNLREGNSGGAAATDDHRWRCDRCGYESPEMHVFCGVCGFRKPEDWFCTDCHYENTAYNRFCGWCGRAAEEEDPLGYEDMSVPNHGSNSLGSEEMAAIEQTHSRMTQHQQPEAASRSPYDDDDVQSFADDSSNVESAAAASASPCHYPQEESQKKEKYIAWQCVTCTFVNENPLFLSCELCGSARPTAVASSEAPAPAGKPHTPPAPEEPHKEKDEDRPQPPPRRNSFAAKSDVSDTSKGQKEKREKRITELMHAYANSQHGGALPEPGADHELAMIYAQQERILAEYQRQQAR